LFEHVGEMLDTLVQSAAGCVSVARDPGKSEGMRVAICVGITAICWILFLALVGGVALLSQ
jgi:hypothetical protein